MISLVLLTLLNVSSMHVDFKDPPCEDIKRWEYLTILRKLDKNHYEVTYNNGLRGILKTLKNYVFDRPGLVQTDFPVKRTGVHSLPVQNGFTGNFQILEQCKPPEF